MNLEHKTNTPKLMFGIVGISAFLALNTSSQDMNFSSDFSSGYFNYEEDTHTPGIANMHFSKSRIDEVREVFPVVRDFTKEELANYNQSLDNLFKPVGVNIFSL